jgi:diguanylate cyclase (GGDEF)-like protein
MTFAVRRPDGERRIVYEQAAARFDALGVTFAVDGITQDITDRAEAEQRIRQLARYDMLTGLPNRWFFAETVTPAMQRARRLGTQCALLHVDMDRFKSVNDALGRAGGDAVLRIIAERIAGVVRVSDLASAGTAGADGFVARFGANAFTVMLLDVGADPDVARVAQRLLDAIEVPLQIDGRELVLSASVGIAMFPRDGEGEVELSRSAEQALYAAKSCGRKQYRFFDEAMHAAASAQLARESELRQAIAQGQLCLHYQPKVNASDGRIVGAEALVRWIHPQRGLIPPGDFIPLAEQSGLIMPLTRWVLDAACADQRRRLDAGLATVPIAVNLAASNFAHDRLLDDLEALLSGYGLGTGWLTLEVTESMLMADIEQAVQRLEALHRRGFTLSLDDFGTGYSSLNYLKRFPIDELKIDRSFIADVASGGRDGALAASIIALAKGLGLSVVAEGVENESQRRFLLAHGCATHQGYHFSRPVPTQAFDGLLASGWIDFGLPARPVA